MQDDQPEKALPPEQPDSSFQYTGSQGDEQQDLQTPPEPEKIVSWSAMEYVEHNKNVGWYGLLIILILGLASGIFLITGGVFAPIIIIAIGSIFFVGAMHRPKQISYQIDSQGISIGNRFYNFDEFKSFSVNGESIGGSISFSPLKRFSPGANIYYDKVDEDKIVDSLSTYLPNQQITPDALELIMRKIRF